MISTDSSDAWSVCVDELRGDWTINKWKWNEYCNCVNAKVTSEASNSVSAIVCVSSRASQENASARGEEEGRHDNKGHHNNNSSTDTCALVKRSFNSSGSLSLAKRAIRSILLLSCVIQSISRTLSISLSIRSFAHSTQLMTGNLGRASISFGDGSTLVLLNSS